MSSWAGRPALFSHMDGFIPVDPSGTYPSCGLIGHICPHPTTHTPDPFSNKERNPWRLCSQSGGGEGGPRTAQLSQETRKSELSSPRFSYFFTFDPHTCSRQQGFPWRPALQIKNPGSGHCRWGALNALEPCVPCRGKQAQAWT